MGDITTKLGGSDKSEERLERLKWRTQILVTLTAVVTLIAASLGLLSKNQIDARQEAQSQVKDLSGTVGSLQQQNKSLEAQNNTLKVQVANLSSPTESVAPSPASAVKQLLGTDIQVSSTTGNEWHLQGPGTVNGRQHDQVVSMGWCSQCLDESTTSGYAEFDLETRSAGTLQVTVGQSDHSADSNGRFRFDIQLDGMTKFSRTLGFGTSIPVSIPLGNALRVRFVVTLISAKVDAATAFADPTVTFS